MPQNQWKNHIKEQIAHPIHIYEPDDLTELKAIIKKAVKSKTRIKAVGSGHSWSDVCLTTGYLIKPNKLDQPLELRTELLKPRVKTKFLVEVESGITIEKLNRYLDKRELALPNMGGYDGQTIVGATATSTHGSGIKYGPLCDMIQSLDMIAGNCHHYRIEPQIGPTDPVAYKRKYGTKRSLVQDDDWFYSCLVSVGCLGIVYSVILKVAERRFMKEVRQITDWPKVKAKLRRGLVDKHTHFEILVNPYTVNRKRIVLTTVREKFSGRRPHKKDLKRNFLVEFGSKIVQVGDLYKLVFKDPTKSPKLIERTIKGLEDKSYVGRSFDVYNIGEANHIPSYSAEIALPMKNDKYLDAVENLFVEVAKLRKDGLYLSGAFVLRFVKKSKAYLSPMFNRDTCMVEIILLKGNPGAKEIYRRLEMAMKPFGARMHWGQFNFLTSDKVKKDYPKFNEWKKVSAILNPDGIFNNEFSDRVGLSYYS